MTELEAFDIPGRKLGSGPDVSVLGLGCMGMAEFYGPSDKSESVRTIRRAVDRGVTLIDTAYMYGGGRSEQIVGEALAGATRHQVTLATKCGLVRTADGVAVNGRPEHLRAAVEESLSRLRTDHVDLLYLHRVDPDVPVEESIGAMSDLVSAGKTRYLGISEAGPDSLRRAHATHPMAALQSEFSLATREPLQTLLPVCVELGIGFVAWGPLSRGLLTGTLAVRSFPGDDIRSVLPRFDRPAMTHNVRVVEQLREIAAGHGWTVAQLSLAWVLAQGAVAIPGAMNLGQLEENLGAAAIQLDAAILRRIDEIAPPGTFAGDRFHAPMLSTVDR
ncbi:aldo/keto reductase [Actinoplanes sp. N902-109]|uniref:aldo/keto reductase n=1 Tax=Actinoplanes sp. (strain N902-109) TaxID=649831 RepID=UPI000329485D|nr:aldo/keto reductase [Actinoplanes sp. N902-109]AGL13747.1 aldo/keto reductase [Actinoplanes sp. N902-109]